MLLLFSFGCSAKTKEELYSQGLNSLNTGDPARAIVFFRSALEHDERYADARFQLAKAFVAVAKYEQAEKEFIRTLDSSVDKKIVKLELARVYNLTRRPVLAIKEAQELISMVGETADVLEVLGIAYAINDQAVEAERYLLQVLQKDSTRLSTKLELAALKMALDSQSEARQLLAEVITADPQNSRAFYLLAALEISLGNRDRAIETYRKIYNFEKTDSMALYKAGLLHIEKLDFSSAGTVADELLTLFPKRAEGYRLRGIVLYYQKKYSDAIVVLQQSIKAQANIEAYYFLGLSLYQRNELENALSQFNAILNNNPDSVRARLMTSIILLRQKRVDDAVTQAQKLVSRAPKFALARNVLGSAYMAKGQYDQGMKEFNTAVALDPGLVDTYLKRGIYYLDRGRDKEAETELKCAIQLAPEIMKTRMMLASYYMRLKEFSKAMELLQQGVRGGKEDAALYNYMAAISMTRSRQEDGLHFLRKAKESDPAFYSAYFNLALYYAAAGKTDEALEEYRSVLRRDTRNVDALLHIAALLDVRGRSEEAREQYVKALETKSEAAYLALANYHLKRNELSRALSVYEKAIRILPRNAAILEARGRALVIGKKYREAIRVFDDLESVVPDRGLPLKIKAVVQMGDSGKAEEEARRIILLRPASAYGYLILASIYEHQNRLEQAVIELNNGLKVDRSNLQTYLVIGGLYARMNMTDQAMAVYEQALRINPDFVPAIYDQGVLLEKLGKKGEALKKYRFALTKAENYMPALNNLAYLYVDGYGNVQEGLRLVLTGYRQDWESPEIMDTLGYALLKNGRYAHAQNVLARAVEMMPNNPTVLYHHALAYKEIGASDRAAATLQKSLSFGDFPDAAAARKLLLELKR